MAKNIQKALGGKVKPYDYKPNVTCHDDAVKISDPWGKTTRLNPWTENPPKRGDARGPSGKKNNNVEMSKPTHKSKIGKTDQFN
jgi:hypothetical protein